MLHSGAPQMVPLSFQVVLPTCVQCGNVFLTNPGHSSWSVANNYNIKYHMTDYTWAKTWYAVNDFDKTFLPSTPC